ncbi:MAG: hypothetical protein K8I82_14830, partial [Anaerolineae bacterium]|nr:hypothetical protein [Anaerolineae bacterium]
RRLFLLGLLPSGVLMLFGAPLFAFIFGPQWEPAGRYTQILAPAFLIQFVVSSISSVIIILELQHLQLIWDIVRLAFLVIVMVAAKYGNWNADLTVLLYGVVLALTYIFHFLYQWRALNRFVTVPGKTHET